MDINDITDFLPKYPNITPYEQEVFNPYSDNKFYENIYKKKEFYDQRLESEEDFPSEVGQLMKHQNIIARFFASYTPYDSLLLVHSMGTGKSCSAIGAIEAIRKQDAGFKRAYFFAKGNSLIDNFKQEIAFKCTNGRYIPADYQDLTKQQKVTRLNKSLNTFYSFDTFDKFAKKISNMTPDMIAKQYSNIIIVIDEVHNLRLKKDNQKLNMYKEFWKFLHAVKGCKILLMSGTPIKDDVREIASIMNLILPINAQLPTDTEFLTNYFDRQSSDPPPVTHRQNADDSWYIYNVKSNRIDDLKRALKGRVSYLSTMPSKVPKVMQGTTLGGLKHFNVVENKMSKFQTTYYSQAYQEDIGKDKSGIYDQSRQASLFVFPDGSWGSKGFKKYIKSQKKGVFTGDDGVKKQLSNFSMHPDLKDALNASTTEGKLEKLKKFSTIYHASIINILQSQKEGKNVFIFNRFVEGSGLILFGLILESFGFSKASATIPEFDQEPRYVILTDKTISSGQIKNVINRFNKPDNVQGKIINVIMGSSILREGFSFQNIQIIDIQNPWFNYSEIDQAIARGYRLGSHRQLIGLNINPIVDVYQRVAVPDPIVMNPPVSIDLYMYELSERKDISIKNVERLIKEAAFDCALNFARNRIDAEDGSRDCEYMECDYECDGIDMSMVNNLNPDELDYSTFQLYYSTPNINIIINIIINLFKTIFITSLDSLYLQLNEFSKFDIISALYTMINQNTPIYNKYGLISYIKEYNNAIFLIDSLSVIGSFLSDYYTQYPYIIPFNNTFKDIYNKLYYDTKLPDQINKICKMSDPDTIINSIKTLPLEIQEYFIEASLQSQKLNKPTTITRDVILNKFSNYYGEIDGTIASWYLYESQNIIYCFDENKIEWYKWIECTDQIAPEIEKIKTKVKKTLETNPYGYYGQYNDKDDKFCIRDVSQDLREQGGHKQTRGKVCSFWEANQLYDLAIDILNIPIPKTQPSPDIWIPRLSTKDRKYINTKASDVNNKEKLWNNIVSKIIGLTAGAKPVVDQNGNLKYNKQYIMKQTPEKIHQIIYWSIKKKEQLCEELKIWFEEQGLMKIEPQCGKKGK
jgi:hypothetical protein